jgi:predicted enzyme related to lactoylglutathione lyase
VNLRVCIDVSDMRKAVAFYQDGLGLSVGRRYRENWTEMLGAPVPLDLLAEAEGSTTARGATRSFQRHWTPVHLDFLVDNLESAVERAVKAGAGVDHGIRERPYGRIAVLADPFGNGFCLLEMRGRGYDVLATAG